MRVSVFATPLPQASNARVLNASIHALFFVIGYVTAGVEYAEI